MTNRIRAGIALLAIGHWLAGCDTASRSPTAPSVPPTSAPAPPVLGGVLGQGTVFDTAFRWVAGARVEVLDGPQAGLSAMTGPTGEFSLSGSFDRSTRIRITRDGYIPEIQPLGVPHAVYYLFVSAPPVNVVGAYTMTFTADATCTNLPNDLRSRTYQVAITPGLFDPIPPHMVFDLKLAGADILENPSIGVAGDVVGFKLFSDGYPYIVERVTTNMHVAITGWAEIANWRVGGSEFAVPFDGWIEYFGSPPSQARPLVTCQSKSHQLRLTRR